MAGWEKIKAPAIQLATMNNTAGTHQLAWLIGPFLTSAKTSPGATNTFIRREVSDEEAGSGACGGGVMSSVMIWFLVLMVNE
jgi:hypothetical protein